MHGVIEFHLEGLRFEGEPVPAPQSEATYLMRNRLTSSSSNVLVAVAMVQLRGWTASFNVLPQQRLYFLPLPQGHGSFRLGTTDARIGLRSFA
jgi:hypothetical protein